MEGDRVKGENKTGENEKTKYEKRENKTGENEIRKNVIRKKVINSKRTVILVCFLLFLLLCSCETGSDKIQADSNPGQTKEATVESQNESGAISGSKSETEPSYEPMLDEPGCKPTADEPGCETISDESGKLTAETANETALASSDLSTDAPVLAAPEAVFDLCDVPAYTGEAFVTVNQNVPFFTEDDFVGASQSYESYSPLDSAGRCGVCVASVGLDIMPTEERGEIGMLKPSGWKQAKYPGLVDGNYLYNRCHLIGYQLSGENANEKNLITGTRALNVEGMLPFEEMVADYVRDTGNHVLYRVTPIFEGDNPLASGVLMEAESVEDQGKGILFCVFCYNAQPGISIDYETGESKLLSIQEPEETLRPTPGPEETSSPTPEPELTPIPEPTKAPSSPSQSIGKYAVNSKNGKIHIVGACPATGTGKNAMKAPVYFDTYEEAESYSIKITPGLEKRKCGNCW